MNKHNLYPHIREVVLSTLVAVLFYLWHHSTAAGMCLGILTLAVGEWIADITCAITSLRQQRAVSDTTEGKDASIECHQ